MRQSVLETTKVLQIAFIVADVEATAKKYATLLGTAVPPICLSGAYKDALTEYKGKPSEARCKMAFFDLDNIQLEFIEPDDHDSDWKASLEATGDCLHHIAFEVKGMKEQIAKLESEGMECIQKGEYQGGRYAFIDSADQYMVKFELLEND